MKIINDSASNKKLLISVLLGVGTGFAALMILLCVFAFIMLKADLGDGTANALSTVALIVSSTMCGFVSSKKLGSRIMIIAPFSGFVFYLTVAVIGAALTKESLGKLFVIRLLLCVVFAGVGALLGVIKQNRRNII